LWGPPELKYAKPFKTMHGTKWALHQRSLDIIVPILYLRKCRSNKIPPLSCDKKQNQDWNQICLTPNLLF
jgi:hypothetical protein